MDDSTEDRRLLQLAARAAGIELNRWNETYVSFETADGLFNPLLNDGDALRLAVKLRLDVHYEWQSWPFGEDGAVVSKDIEIVEIFYDRIPEEGRCKCIMEMLGDDPAAATRRAVVRAAAAIGERGDGND